MHSIGSRTVRGYQTHFWCVILTGKDNSLAVLYAQKRDSNDYGLTVIVSCGKSKHYFKMHYPQVKLQ